MSVFLLLEKENEQKARVMLIHNFPHMLSDVEKKGGVLIDSYSEAVEIEGKIALPYYNYQTNGLYYEYIDKPKSENEIMADKLRVEMAQANTELFEMMMAMNGGLS